MVRDRLPRATTSSAALNEVAAVALRYGASSYAVYRSRDDRYRFQQLAEFEEHLDWERYWEGPEMTYFRASHSSWYQVPVLYALVGPDARQASARNGADCGARRPRQRPRQRRPRLEGEHQLRARQPCSSGAIVSPAPFSCSQ